MKNIIKKISNMWDPRKNLAEQFLVASEKYEEQLKQNKNLDPKLVDALISERNRIHSLFQQFLPEYKEKISIVITNDAYVESCSIFRWKEQIFILVSSAMIGRPIDHPKENGLKAWEWLVRHEITHLKRGHLTTLFRLRKFHKIATYLLNAATLFFYMLPRTNMTIKCLQLSLFLWLGSLLLKIAVSLTFEYIADRNAACDIKDCLVLEDAEKTLRRIKSQAINRLGYLRYTVASLFVDPHPLLATRIWILNKYKRHLKKTLVNN